MSSKVPIPLLEPRLPDTQTPIVKWGKLYGAAAALAVAEGAARARGPLIVIAQSSREAEALGDEIRFFAGTELKVRVFPDLETLPYDAFSAHPDITSARLATLAELPRARQGVWLVAIDTLMQRLAPRSYVEAYSLKVHVGETLDLEALRAQLALAGYAAVTQVVAHGAKVGRKVSLCGDAGGEPKFIGALLGTGLRALSVSPAALGSAKEAIARVNIGGQG